METEIIKYALTQGAFCALFVWLLVDTRRDAKKREEGYQETIVKSQETINANQKIISQLTEKFSILEDVKSDLRDLRTQFFKQ